MVNFVEVHNGEIYMHVESKDGDKGIVDDNFNGVNEGYDDNNSEESIPNVRFDESEEERENNMDDGFDIAISEG